MKLLYFILIVALTGCAPVLAIKETSPAPLAVASITPMPPTTKKQNFSSPSVVANRPPANRLYELHFTTCGTPLTPPSDADVAAGLGVTNLDYSMQDYWNYFPLSRTNLDGIGFDKRAKDIYVSHDLITWTLAMSNSMAAFFYTDNAPCCFFRVGQNKPSNVSVDELCNITIIARSF